jgi:hypothetical protein
MIFLRVAILVALVTPAALALARTEPNSFINRPAYTLSDLLDQVRNDKVVASRFTRHFGMTKEEVVDYFSTLRLGRLKTDGVYLIYNVPDWEEVRSRAVFYRKGTLVWTDDKGNPILKASCGNPMVRGTDIGLARVSPSVGLVTSSGPRDLVALSTPETVPSDFAPETMAPSLAQTSAIAALPPEMLVPAVTTQPISPLLIVPIVGGLALGVNTTDPNPIPEPATVAVFAMAAGWAAVRARRNGKAG